MAKKCGQKDDLRSISHPNKQVLPHELNFLPKENLHLGKNIFYLSLLSLLFTLLEPRNKGATSEVMFND